MPQPRCYPDLPKLYLTRAQRGELGVCAGSPYPFRGQRVEVLMPARENVREMNDGAFGYFVPLSGEAVSVPMSDVRAELNPEPRHTFEAGAVGAAVVSDMDDDDDPDDDDDFGWIDHA